MRIFPLAVAALLLVACGARGPKRQSVQSKSATEAAERTLRGLQRALRLEVWGPFEELLSPEAYEGSAALKRKLEDYWRSNEVVSLKIDLVKLLKDKDVYVAHVKWVRSVVGRDKQLVESTGKSQVLLKKEGGGDDEAPETFKILHVQGDPLY